MFELEHETSAGRLLAETLALSLVARLIQNHAGAPRPAWSRRPQGKGLTGADWRECSTISKPIWRAI